MALWIQDAIIGVNMDELGFMGFGFAVSVVRSQRGTDEEQDERHQEGECGKHKRGCGCRGQLVFHQTERVWILLC